MKRKKAALYDPYLDVMGGGERHILAMMKALEDAGYEIHIFWDQNLNEQIKNKLNLHFVSPIIFRNNIFNTASFVEKMSILSAFDMFLYVTDGSYFLSGAKQNGIFCMVPNKHLYNMSFVNKLKTKNATFISNSQFTHGWLEKWGIQSTVIYPSLDNHFFNVNLNEEKKEPIILSVGRFFKHLHAKKQDVIINIFKEMKKKHTELKSVQLILAGSVKDEDKEYINELQELIGNDTNIQLKTNLSHEELMNLYKKAAYYWHFAGYGVDENKHPEQVEHLGITPLEAMASGCITFCYNAGGPKEIIQDGNNGFLFSSEDELTTKVNTILNDKKLQSEIRQNAQTFVHQHFRYDVLKKKIWDLFDIKEQLDEKLMPIQGY